MISHSTLRKREQNLSFWARNGGWLLIENWLRSCLIDFGVVEDSDGFRLCGKALKFMVTARGNSKWNCRKPFPGSSLVVPRSLTTTVELDLMESGPWTSKNCRDLANKTLELFEPTVRGFSNGDHQDTTEPQPKGKEPAFFSLQLTVFNPIQADPWINGNETAVLGSFSYGCAFVGHSWNPIRCGRLVWLGWEPHKSILNMVSTNTCIWDTSHTYMTSVGIVCIDIGLRGERNHLGNCSFRLIPFAFYNFATPTLKSAVESAVLTHFFHRVIAPRETFHWSLSPKK